MEHCVNPGRFGRLSYTLHGQGFTDGLSEGEDALHVHFACFGLYNISAF